MTMKYVYVVKCRYCQLIMSQTVMKAQLLSSLNHRGLGFLRFSNMEHFYSTQYPSVDLRMTDESYVSSKCECRVCNTACGQCGNLVGYHILKPCYRCLYGPNPSNGHLWIFIAAYVDISMRVDEKGQHVTFNDLEKGDLDLDLLVTDR